MFPLLFLPPILAGGSSGGGGGGAFTEGDLRTLVGLYFLPTTSLSTAASLRGLVGLYSGPYNAVPIANPALLPVANKQVADWPAYQLLNVPGMSAGDFYADPVTGIGVTKLTSATFPAANAGMLHPYSSNGLQISGVWNGSKYTIYLMASSGAGYLVDYDRGTRAMTDARSTPWSSDTRFTFSMDPATPQIVYYMTSAARLVRFNTDPAVMAEAPNAAFPVGGKDFAGLITGGAQQLIAVQCDVNDRTFLFMNVAGTEVFAWDAVTNVLQSVTVARVNAIRASTHIDEQHIDHDGRYSYIKLQEFVPMGGGVSSNTMLWDLQTGFLSDLVGAGWSHHAGLRSIATGINAGDFSQESYTPAPVTAEGAAGVGTLVKFATDSQVGGGESHRAGQWTDQGSIGNQQYVMLSQEAPQNDRSKQILALVWSLVSGSIYSTTISYQFQQVALGGVRDVLELSSGRLNVTARLTQKADLASITGPGQWAITGTTLYVWRNDSLQPNNTTRPMASQVVAVAHETLTFMRLDNGDTRILGHHYSWNPDSGDYYSQPRTTISRDGLLVISDSNMNLLGGRTDVFAFHTPYDTVAPAGPAIGAIMMYHRRRRINAAA